MLHDNELQEGYIQQDGARARTAREAINYLGEFFEDRIISLNMQTIFPPTPCDLNPCCIGSRFNLCVEIFGMILIIEKGRRDGAGGQDGPTKEVNNVRRLCFGALLTGDRKTRRHLWVVPMPHSANNNGHNGIYFALSSAHCDAATVFFRRLGARIVTKEWQR
ncbi:hypothetical protein NQ318_007397 [Aromia moschata]|uniref:Uncharacterized protein n=1 Tax=Aromia moschata TaxID=1265417 RepID=A0AAV8YF86_9CUCU|nr:hypothetical protein NQ318_007397 [Aromia moschata]